MEVGDVREKLIVVLQEIQRDSGLTCPNLTGANRPIADLPMFDSMVWPVATTLLAGALAATIPDEQNIFIDSKTKQPRSIDEIAVFVAELVQPSTKP